MDRRGVTATFCATAAGGGIAALVGATALPAGSSYFTILLVIGSASVAIGLVGFVGLLVTVTQSQSSAPITLVIDETPPPQNLDDRGRAMWLLRRARDNSVKARKQWGSSHAQRAFHEIRSATMGTKKAFGVGGPLQISNDSDEPTYKQLLAAYIAYADILIPLLEGGHTDAAQRAADSFTWSRGMD